jgi:5-formyltetrahydrofolate cyclo-ligase
MDIKELKAWRKSLRAQLIARRKAASADDHARWSGMIDAHLAGFLNDVGGRVVAFCWPYQAEYDARSLMQRLFQKGARGALPVVVAPRTPLAFRAWEFETSMAPDVYGILAPVGTDEVRPDFALVALNGFDALGYRLGYGAGFFDRTLASMKIRPVTLGVGFELARLATIHPQWHDIPLDFIVTETGIHRRGRMDLWPDTPVREQLQKNGQHRQVGADE